MVVRTTTQNRRRARAIVRWARALVPAAVLVIAPPGVSAVQGSDDDITLDAEEVASGPLSLADAIARAVARSSARGR